MEIALFLGAGASYEVGMPLVFEFSNTLRQNTLKRLNTKLFDFSKDIRVKDFLIELLSNKNLHYEQVVGELETAYLKNRFDSSTLHTALLQLIECIQILLLEEQSLMVPLLEARVGYYSGLKKFLNDYGSSYVFSLNHDVIFEEICNYHGLPLKDGFFSTEDTYTSKTRFNRLSTKQIYDNNYDFFDDSMVGFNLIKMHGALDIFAIENETAFVKVKGTRGVLGSHITEISQLEKESYAIYNSMNVRPVNELFIKDTTDELQFLRRSLLSGSHKFQDRFDQIAPKAFFELFKSKINEIRKIIFIGYSFGDSHINAVIQEWLQNPNNIIEIYDPYRRDVPLQFIENKPQITIRNQGFTDFCLSCERQSIDEANNTYLKSLDFARDCLKKRRLGEL